MHDTNWEMEEIIDWKTNKPVKREISLLKVAVLLLSLWFIFTAYSMSQSYLQWKYAEAYQIWQNDSLLYLHQFLWENCTTTIWNKEIWIMTIATNACQKNIKNNIENKNGTEQK